MFFNWLNLFNWFDFFDLLLDGFDLLLLYDVFNFWFGSQKKHLFVDSFD